MTTESKPSPVPPFGELQPYLPPVHPAPVDLRLAGNEGDHPPASLLASLAGRETEVLRSYPNARGLEKTLASRLGIDAEQVVVTAGGDEAIDRLCRVYLGPGRRVVMPQPTFVMFPHYAKLAGADIQDVPWPDGPYPTEAVLAAVDAATAMITIVTPNNPSGAVARAEDLQRLAAAAPHAVLVVDLAYAEYADDDLTDAALALPNAVIVRTISKAWGLAGLRVGYAAGPRDLVAPLRAAGGPFSVAGISIALAEQAVAAGEERKAAHVARVREEREQLRAVLTELGVSSPPSQANFAYLQTGDEARATWLRDGLAGLGIAVRLFPGDPRLAGCLRITCPGDADRFDRLSRALATVLAPQALLFDMDGVLADVSGSYRVAITETAASFDVEVGAEDVAAAKERGNANNDWELTHRLLSAAGVSVTLQEVTERFEELYQGTGDRPGLWRNETLLPPRDLLERLSQRLPLAVVTGRPRHDAERMLGETDITSFFGAVVCLEDAALKPDPAPVRLALEQLGVERGWMIGDTPDDVRAARGAAVVPIGVPPPGDDARSSADSLLRAGAARVLNEICEIEKILPEVVP